MLSPASRTSSSSFFVAMVIKKLASGENGFAKVWIANGAFGYQICGPIEQFFQCVRESKIVIGVFSGRLFLKGHQKIKVAVLRVEATICGRAEQIKAFHPELSADAIERFS